MTIFVYRYPLASSGFWSGERVGSADILLEATNETSVDIPSWDDSEGTVYLDDGTTKRAYAWDSSGYHLSEDGAITAQYPPAWSDPPHSAGTVYYFASAGDNGNDGLSPGAPKQTIAAANALTLSAGDEILFNKGDTWTGTTLTVPDSGSVSNFIKIGAYGTGARPIINANNTQQFALSFNAESYVWVDGLRLTNSANSSNTGAGVGTGGASSNITITDCDISDNQGSGFKATTSARVNIRLKDCLIQDNDAWGIAMIGPTTGGDLSGCVIADSTISGNADLSDGATGTEQIVVGSGDLLLYGNTLSNGRTNDFTIYVNHFIYGADESEGLPRVFNNTIIQDNEWSIGSLTLKGRGGRAYRNTFISGGQYAVTCQQARSFSVTVPPANLSAYVHHNVMYDFSNRLTYPSAGINITNINHALTGVDETGDLYAWNNTIDDMDNGIEIGGLSDADEATLRSLNNLVTNISDEAARITQAVTTKSWDYDYYYGLVGGNDFEWQGTDVTFATWQGTHGQDVNGQQGGDPLYVDSTNVTLSARDYSLGASSPVKSQGTDAVWLVGTDPDSWIGINYVPHATSPDAGAYQYLSGKTLDFSKYFLSVIAGTATTFRLEETRKDASTLNGYTT